MLGAEDQVRSFLRSALVISALSPMLGCGGAPAPEPEKPTAGGDGQGGDRQGEQPGEAASENAEPGAADSAPEQPRPTSVPTGEGDCMEFHLKLLECSKVDGSLGPGEEARMRESAEAGCVAANEDSENPVTGFVRQLWARCKDLPCADAEGCFLSGMAELSAPPGPYLHAPK